MSDGKDTDTLVGARRAISNFILKCLFWGRPQVDWSETQRRLLERERWLNGIGIVNDWSWR